MAAEQNGQVPVPEAVRLAAPRDFGPTVPINKASAAQSLGYNVNLFEEYGRTGLRHWGGFLFEEWLQQLQQDRRAAEVFREMSDQDAIVGGILYAIEMLMRRVSWWFEPKGSQEADFMEGVIHDMRDSWEDTLGSMLSFLRYGWAYHELCFKKRSGQTRDLSTSSKFTDGKIGLAKLPVRSQDAIWKWVFNDVGETVGLIQNPPPDYLLRFIPREKALHLTTTTFKENPSGRSILRTAYHAYYMARNLRAIEGIGFERGLAGLPVLTPPEGVDIWDTEDPAMAGVLQNAKNTVSSIRRDEQEGVVKPYGWALELLAVSSRFQGDIGGAIMRYENNIATSVLADIIKMGQQQVGSYALSVTKKDLLAASLGGFLDIVSSRWDKQVTPTLWRLNGMDPEKMPRLKHGAVETIDLDTLGNFILRLGNSGAPIPWETTLPWMLDQANIPEPPANHDYSPRPVGGGAVVGSTDAAAKTRLTPPGQ